MHHFLKVIFTYVLVKELIKLPFLALRYLAINLKDFLEAQNSDTAAILLGQGSIDKILLQKSLNDYPGQVNIYQDLRKKSFQCKGLKIKSHKIYINAHIGSNLSELTYDLCRESSSPKLQIKLLASQIYLPLLSNNNLNFELFGLGSGKIISDINPAISDLPFYSTLISTSSDQFLSHKIIIEDLLIYSSAITLSDPYLRYVYYLISNPDKTGFAINLPKEVKTFFSHEIKLNHYSNDQVKEWENLEVKIFINFYKEISRSNNFKNAEFELFIEEFYANQSFWYTEMQNSLVSKFKERLSFIFVARHNNTEASRLIDTAMGVKAALYDGTNLMMIAAYYNNLEIMQRLLSAKLDVNIKYNNALSALIFAVAGSNLPAVQFLKENYAEINIPFSNGLNPLVVAVNKQSIPIANYLIQSGIDVNSQYRQGTVISIAIDTHNCELVKLLLSHGVKSIYIDFFYIKRTNDICIDEAVVEYLVNPIKYILEYNKNYTDIIKAVNNLSSQDDFVLPTGLIECLEKSQGYPSFQDCI